MGVWLLPGVVLAAPFALLGPSDERSGETARPGPEVGHDLPSAQRRACTGCSDAVASGEGRSRPCEEAGRRFERALGILRAARRASGAKRVELRREAAASLSALRDEHPGDLELGGEARFRAAEVWLALGDEPAARREYERLGRLDTPAEWRCRAWFELGQLERRAERWSEALAAYLRAASTEGGARRWRDEATLWAAKTHAARREFEPARRLLAWTAEHSPDVFLRIRAFDEWALSFVAVDDLGAAAGVLEACRSATRKLAFEQTARGERVLRALERMRCIAALERAVERSLSAPRPSAGAASSSRAERR
jgi:tetratricopeptide (TPR) repeat protein